MVDLPIVIYIYICVYPKHGFPWFPGMCWNFWCLLFWRARVCALKAQNYLTLKFAWVMWLCVCFCENDDSHPGGGKNTNFGYGICILLEAVGARNCFCQVQKLLFGIFCLHVSSAEHGDNMIKSELNNWYIEGLALENNYFQNATINF